jgi:hypothetical protein
MSPTAQPADYRSIDVESIYFELGVTLKEGIASTDLSVSGGSNAAKKEL